LRHPQADNKLNGMTDLKVKHNSLNNNCYEVNVIYNDGSIKDISWILCITGKEKNQYSLLMSALRYSIQDQILTFKENQFIGKCELCLKHLTNDVHIDHVILFKIIVENFHKQNPNLSQPVTFEDARDGSNRAVFSKTDELYEYAWKEYHKEHAILRVLCAKCNLQRSKKA
jgi:hypothetical protein